MNTPTATYRLQLNASFGFRSVLEIVDYLKQLGISHVYASPILKARRKSPHGYDGVDPGLLNPDLGTQEDFENLVHHLKNRDMGWLQDIVPNHMAYDFENPVLRDILEYGSSSVYYEYLDITLSDRSSPAESKLIAPFLGNYFETCLWSGQIRLKFSREGFSINYFDLKLPLAIGSYGQLLKDTIEVLSKKLGEGIPAFGKFNDIANRFRHLTQKGPGPERDGLVSTLKDELWNLYRQEPDIANAIDQIIQFYNHIPDQVKSHVPVSRLLDAQFFRLRFWKTAGDEINYRRFFDINELIALRQEREPVFRWSHQLILQFIEEAKIDGLRIDHIDGLVDPAGYLDRLRKAAGKIYLVVEKILEHYERLPQSWPVEGTTGYEFSSRVESLFVCRENERAMKSVLTKFNPNMAPFEQILISSKRQIMVSHFTGDLDNLVNRMMKLALRLSIGADITRPRLKAALGEVVVHFPVYRTYTASGNITEEDKTYIQHTIEKAFKNRPDLSYEFEFLQKVLLKSYDVLHDQEITIRVLHKSAVAGFEQLTAPLMAKGLEDTSHYRYPVLLSLNEVGATPDLFGATRRSFHQYMTERAEKWPHAMSSSSTHDSKRGEDVRARLNVLSEIPDQWEQVVFNWHTLNREKKIHLKDKLVPDSTEEYFIYQTLVGSWPLEGDTEPPYLERLERYAVKFLREAKVHSSWHSPVEEYEKSVLSFVQAILDQAGGKNRFMEEFIPFCRMVSFYGIFNSLSQTLIKITAPGIPDFFQGTEFMNLHLVDPDNRRLVDYQRRKEFIREIEKKEPDQLTDIFPEPKHLTGEADRLKLFLIMKSLNFRRANPRLFLESAYIPIQIEGPFSRHVVAFARQVANQWSMTAVPRFLTGMIDTLNTPLGTAIWKDTAAVLPSGAPSRWKNIITNQYVISNNRLPMGELFRFFPVALLAGDEEK